MTRILSSAASQTAASRTAVSRIAAHRAVFGLIAAAGLLALCFTLFGCSGGGGGEAPAAQDPSLQYAEPEVDLTVLSSTMVYSEVFNMLSYPQDYEGKTVRARGMAATAQAGEAVYHAVVIADATACCAQGLEYVLDDGAYPEDGIDVTVEGVFGTYIEDGYTYCTLYNARVVG